MTLIGLLIILAVFASYFTMLFALRRFTYKTWILHVAVGLGVATGALGWFLEGTRLLSVIDVGAGVAWFLLTTTELRLVGSGRLNLHPGDTLPAMTFLKTDGARVTEQDLIAHAPALLALYRGWWCPSSKAQLGKITGNLDGLLKRGIAIYAASVDEPAEAAALQDYVGNRITILCNASEQLLDKIGVLDARGAPWYDRILFGAKRRPIAIPATLGIGKNGKVTLALRSRRVDEPPWTKELLEAL